ncbi:type VI secretion system amidase immunity protein Tai4 [Zymobacter sp. IVIA_5232.4 C2]|uniref:type VI secretion system amidase immunity protein Tai4 n=1 Tax=Zymobacter sp. IVIA_5232.4 C2 TaxID=3394855 RepID=UPI0039C0C772
MSKISFSMLAAFTLIFWSSTSYAHKGPEAGSRSYAQNYKDMVLTTCIAKAYAGDKNAAMDAGSSVSALVDWTSYDLEKSPDAVKSLVDRYLARDYYNPLVESDIKGVKFDMLKCLDMYHSKELDTLTKKMVINPNHTYRQDIKK